MRISLCLLFLSLAALPLAAQPDRRLGHVPEFPPEIISPDELPRDIVRIAPTHVRVDFENGRTRVLRLTLAAFETIPAHDDRLGVLVCLTACRIRFTMPDGATQDLDLKAGETHWLPEARRTIRNTAALPVEMLYIETKRPQT